MAAAVTSLWPNPVGMGDVARGPVRRELEADEATRRRIARSLGLQSLDSLTASVGVSAWLDGAEVKGRWSAALTQTCVVTLDPLATELSGEFVIRLVPPDSDAAPGETEEIDLDPEADDPPDIMESDVIDVGHYVVEHLALEIDPFPRKPGVEFVQPDGSEPESPFAVLRKLQDPGKDG